MAEALKPGPIETVLQSPAAEALRQRLGAGGALPLGGVHTACHGFLTAALHGLLQGGSLLVVAPGVKAQEILEQDLQTWLGWGKQEGGPTGFENLLYYPPWEVLPHESRLPHSDVISERLETLTALCAPPATGKKGFLILTTEQALLQRTLPPRQLMEGLRHFKKGDQIDPLDLVEWLEDQGYEPEAKVTHKGELALRGGILDVWPPTASWPARLEFFGDELESIRTFDPGTQRSRDPVETVTLCPSGELGVMKAALKAGSKMEAGSLAEYLPAGTAVLLLEPDLLAKHAGEYLASSGESTQFLQPWEEALAAVRARGGCWITASESGVEGGGAIDPGMQSLDAWRPLDGRLSDPQVGERQRTEFFAQLHRWMRQGFRVEVVCNNSGERDRFAEIWREQALGDAMVPELHLGALSRGVHVESAKLVVVTDAEVFGRYKVSRPRRLRSPHAAASRSLLDIDFGDLEPGDLVVHLQHGIGKYTGLQMVPRVSAKRRPGLDTEPEDTHECLAIEYAPSDPAQPPPKLYVPVTESHLVSKYVGAGKARPQLNTLGGARWAKARAQAEEAVRDLAGDMLSIQAARDSQPGYAFGPDTAWQREFESAFLYQETPDQIRAIDAAKRDLETPRPMDRLICGDVGYGKTEVAIRTAFKAVMGGKQVAILVPTTVLAQQHFNTFRERMADYPVRIEQLSRFRTKAQQSAILQQMAEGAVDIIIGTHRLVQDDVVFKDLGLVVIDEEQRFGVLHKEKLKLMRKMVDVLTLSATPIPRTLYLALTGARDLSTIETPPQDRLPVETIVSQYDERMIRDAIQRELNRGGQTFFLHNRVEDIYEVAAKLKALLPAARVVVGHGQMDAGELEDVMASFINGEADVLLSTTIIESGIDIPNANTIIIDRADRFGLSDLYQLRGRVGRYKHQAYALLMLPRHAQMLGEVRKRISAIKQYSSLGSGFKIAMRDLEIRGAGNLLGAQQSGHITAVGFDLYCQLLRQSVASLKGEKVQRRPDVTIRLDFIDDQSGRPSTQRSRDEDDDNARPGAISAAMLPQDYVQEPRQRIEIYRKLAQAANREDVEAVKTEVRDRFGVLPAAVELLMQLAQLKLLAGEKGVTVVENDADKLKLTRNGDFIQLGGRFPRLTKRDPKARLNEIKKLLLAM